MKCNLLLFVILISFGIVLSNEATQTDEEISDDNIESVVKELHLEQKTELTKSEARLLFKLNLKRQKENLKTLVADPNIKEAARQFWIDIEKDVMDSLPDKILFKDLHKYFKMDVITNKLMQMILNVGKANNDL